MEGRVYGEYRWTSSLLYSKNSSIFRTVSFHNYSTCLFVKTELNTNTRAIPFVGEIFNENRFLQVNYNRHVGRFLVGRRNYDNSGVSKLKLLCTWVIKLVTELHSSVLSSNI